MGSLPQNDENRRTIVSPVRRVRKRKSEGGLVGTDRNDEDADQELYFLMHLRHDATLLQPEDVDDERQAFQSVLPKRLLTQR